ncbi:hypothetical protein ACFR99_19640 [Haloarchaeobius amylolyticus]|uniref:Outer membrane lipoprotein-sorting protein n=1 Tax=Haloarchaeobius amylolyticus TaxID=1198296 RepID=A0ABD6BLY1_9EURY
MKRSVIIMLAVVVLTTTAGCAGVLRGGATGGNDGEVAESSAATEDKASESVTFPNGTGENGLDADELTSRQTTVLEDGSYVVETREASKLETGTYEESIVLSVDGDRKIQKTKFEYEPATEDSLLGPSGSETWLFTESANETLVRRIVDSNERYRVENGPVAPRTDERHLRDELEAVLRVSEYELTDVEEADGSTVVTYEGTEVSDELDQLYPLIDEYHEVAVTVSVSDDGIERYAYEFEATTVDGYPETIAVETTFSSVGETELGRPEWVHEGFERAPAASISTDGEKMIALTLESGDPIPENARVSVSPISGYYVASLDEALEPGETLYLTVRDGQLLASVDVKPDAGDAIDTEWFTVSATTEGGITAYEGTYEEPSG